MCIINIVLTTTATTTTNSLLILFLLLLLLLLIISCVFSFYEKAVVSDVKLFPRLFKVN